jgi:hypothetical protein
VVEVVNMELVMFLEQMVDLVVEAVTPAVLVLVTHLKLIQIKVLLVEQDLVQDLVMQKVVEVAEQLPWEVMLLQVQVELEVQEHQTIF